MDIIRKANVLRNVLDEDDLLLFENHSLDKEYTLFNSWPQKKVTKLMLLINILHKYPTKSSINNIIKEYIKEVPNEINEVSQYGDDALKICASYNNNFDYENIARRSRYKTN